MGSRRIGRKASEGYVNHNTGAEVKSEIMISGTVTAPLAQLAVGLAPPHAGAPPAPVLPGQPAKVPHAVVLAAHVANANAAAAEIESSGSFTADFGSFVLSKKPLADGLLVARAWSEEAVHARAWDAYVATQNATAWNAVLAALQPLAEAFTVLAARDPTLASRYPALAAFLGARAEEGRKVAARRKHGGRKRAASPPAAAAPPANGAVANGAAANAPNGAPRS
jgi:hypothetical protein